MVPVERELTEEYPEKQFVGQLVNQYEDPYTLNAAKKKKKDEDDLDEEDDDYYEEEEEETPFDVEPSEDDLIEDEFPDDEDDLFDEEEDNFR